VGTPSQANGNLDLTYMKHVCEEIGDALRDKASGHLVVFRSTMLPGTSEDVLLPILEARSGKMAGAGFEVCYNPEFLREGSSVYDFYNPPKIVVGEEAAQESAVPAYSGIVPPIRRQFALPRWRILRQRLSRAESDFANEIGNLCKKMGSTADVMSIFCEDKN
jgi:GDP-mannose 6-dehydrogenase